MAHYVSIQQLKEEVTALLLSAERPLTAKQLLAELEARGIHVKLYYLQRALTSLCDTNRLGYVWSPTKTSTWPARHYGDFRPDPLDASDPFEKLVGGGAR